MCVQNVVATSPVVVEILSLKSTKKWWFVFLTVGFSYLFYPVSYNQQWEGNSPKINIEKAL